MHTGLFAASPKISSFIDSYSSLILQGCYKSLTFKRIESKRHDMNNCKGCLNVNSLLTLSLSEKFYWKIANIGRKCNNFSKCYKFSIIFSIYYFIASRYPQHLIELPEKQFISNYTHIYPVIIHKDMSNAFLKIPSPNISSVLQFSHFLTNRVWILCKSKI